MAPLGQKAIFVHQCLTFVGPWPILPRCVWVAYQWQIQTFVMGGPEGGGEGCHAHFPTYSQTNSHFLTYKKNSSKKYTFIQFSHACLKGRDRAPSPPSPPP